MQQYDEFVRYFERIRELCKAGFTPLDDIEKYDLWCKTCLMDVMNT